MATLAVNPHTNDAALRKNGTGTFASVRGGSTATSVISAAATTVGANTDNASDGSTYYFDRAILPFDTSPIGSGTVTAATLAVTVTSAGAQGTTNNIFLTAVGCNLASAPSIATSDWANVGTTVLVTGLNFDEASTGTKTFTLNAAGLAAINGSGYTTFAVVMSNDQGADPAAPVDLTVGDKYTYCTFYSSTGATPPLLTVTYTAATPAAAPSRRRPLGLYPR